MSASRHHRSETSGLALPWRPGRSAARRRRLAAEPTVALRIDEVLATTPIARRGPWRIHRADVVAIGTACLLEATTRSDAATTHLDALHDAVAGLEHDRLPCALRRVLGPAGTTAGLLWRPAPASCLADAHLALDPAQVVGALADVTTALVALHEHRYVHGGLDPGAVLVDDAGRCTLAGLEHLRRVAPHGTDGRPDDVAALGRLGAALLDRCDPDDGADEVQVIRAVLSRLVDADRARRPDAPTVRTLLERLCPPPRPLRPPARPGDDRSAAADTDAAAETTASVAGRTTGVAAPTWTSDDERQLERHVDVDVGPRCSPDPGTGDGEDRRWWLTGSVPQPSPTLAHDPRAAPAAHGRGRTVVLASAAVALVALGAHQLATAGAATDATAAVLPCPTGGAPAVPAGASVVQADVDGRGCTVSVRWLTGEGVLEVVAPEGVRRYGLGAPGDLVLVADWDCDGAATPLVQRPAAGAAWRFDTWPTGDEPLEPTEVPLAEVRAPTC